jgi:hypothetical protein
MLQAYQKEQLEALDLVLAFLSGLTPARLSMLRADLQPYLDFREKVDRFLSAHFSQVCTRACYQSQLSACCSKDGIITFFADVVVNAVGSDQAQLDRLMRVLSSPQQGLKCLYLTSQGCLWQIKPLICALFLCDSAKKAIFQPNKALAGHWGKPVQRKPPVQMAGSSGAF